MDSVAGADFWAGYGDGLGAGLALCACGLPTRQQLSHYVYPCACGDIGAKCLHDDGGGGRNFPDLENENGRLGGKSISPHWRQFLPYCPAYGGDLGQAYLGYLVGMGCALNLHAAAAVFDINSVQS